MPPPRVGISPLGKVDNRLFSEDDPYGWQITEIEEEYELKPGIRHIGTQIFSDIGVPVVLFMENYDINRSGYHDSKDTLENIDFDYGDAMAAIAIETVARVGCRVKF